MSKLGLFRNAAIRSSPSILNPSRNLPLRRLSTEAEGDQQPETPQQPPPPPPPQQQQQVEDVSSDPFLQGSGQGLVFGKLTGIWRNTMKTDVIHFLEGCNLSTNDVKVEYNRAYTPVSMLLQFPSRSSYDTAARQITRKGRLYGIAKIDRSQWDLTSSYNGKTVLLQGLPPTAIQDDIERFLSGCNFDSATLQIIFRSVPEPMKLALVQFSSGLDAMNALCFKNRSFCQNNPITLRVLH